MIEYVLLGVAVLLFAVVSVMSYLLYKNSKAQQERLMQIMQEEFRSARSEQSQTLAAAIKAQNETQTMLSQELSKRQNEVLRELSAGLFERQNSLQTTLETQQKNLSLAFNNYSMQNNQNLENIRTTVEKRLKELTVENEKKLDEMRNTVDQKLQKTLDEKLSQSFSLVSQRLEQVYKGLGEMQTLAVGVGDLKKVLSGVKTRGILGEVQLSAILEEMLTKDQYYENHPPKPDSGERVEFCIKLPGDESRHVLLPIDAKFPVDAYAEVVEAYETADKATIERAQKNLDTRIRSFAKTIRTKYVLPPHTTDFAVMFLPTEGMFAEVVRYGISQRVQQEYKVIVAGPTTMAALLSSLQMGFKTLQIKKRSSEVWQVLAAVKSEFDNFEKALTQTQTRLQQAQNELESLVGVRTRQMQRKLKGVESTMPLEGEENYIEAITGREE